MDSVSTIQLIIFFIGSYLLGSIPTAYLMVRWLAGFDVREYGSGNVGGSNAGNVTSRWVMVFVGLVDIAKAALPTWLALSVFDLGYPAAVLAGLCSTIGHNWSIFLGFYGGRGLSGIVGTLLIVFPWGALFLLLIMFVGWLLGSTAGSSVGLLGLPLFSFFTNQPAVVTIGCVVMLVITALKRLEANRRPLPAGPERWPTIRRRLWLDRDILDHKKWLEQRPPTADH